MAKSHIDTLNSLFSSSMQRRGRHWSPALREAVRLMLEHDIPAGEKSVGRALHELYDAERIRRFGPAPSPRSVRRIVASIRGGGAVSRRRGMIRLHHVGIAGGSDVYAACLSGSKAPPILVRIDDREVRA